MTCSTQTLDPKTHPLLTSKLFHSRKAGTADLFFPKEVILDHAVEIFEKDHRAEKRAKIETVLARLNRALSRSLKGFFDVTYK